MHDTYMQSCTGRRHDHNCYQCDGKECINTNSVRAHIHTQCHANSHRIHAYHVHGQIDRLHKQYPVFTREDLFMYHKEFQTYDLDGSGDINAFEIMQIFRCTCLQPHMSHVAVWVLLRVVVTYGRVGLATWGCDAFARP